MSTAQNAQPPRIRTHRTTLRRLAVSIPLILLLAAVAILFTFDPVHSNFYPQCIFKKVTGWSCPACGCLRASHQLLHGHLATAFHLNALFVMAVPFAALLGIEQVLHKPLVKKPPFLGWTILVLFIVFGIVRNLPPFSAWSGQ